MSMLMFHFWLTCLFSYTLKTKPHRYPASFTHYRVMDILLFFRHDPRQHPLVTFLSCNYTVQDSLFFQYINTLFFLSNISVQLFHIVYRRSHARMPSAVFTKLYRLLSLFARILQFVLF